MASFTINSPIEIFYETDGTPLEDGYIYIGEAGKNPITNQINVFWDAEFNYPVSQPVRTIAGYPSRNGAPGNLYLNDLIYADYSITVQNKNSNNVLLLSEARSDFTLPHNPSTGYVNVKNFGATGNGTTDDYSAFSQALSFMNTNALKVLYCPRGDYLLGTQLLIDQNGITIMGDGIINTVAIAGPTKFIASHSAGAVIRIRSENCVIRDLYVGATTARNTGAAGFNFGIHAEGVDTSSGAVRGTIIDRVRIAEQPSDGLVMAGEIVSSVVRDCSFDQNDGHGMTVNRGETTGRVDNTFPPGILTISNVRCNRNGGHGLGIGNPSATLLPSFRVAVNQYEGFQNATDAAVRYQNFDSYMNGDGNTVFNTSFGGDSLRGGLFILGRSLSVSECRFVNCTQPIDISHSALSPTNSVVIENIEVRGLAVTYAATCSASATGVRAYGNVGSSTYTTLLQQQDDSLLHEDGIINLSNTAFQSDFNAAVNFIAATNGFRSRIDSIANDSFVNIDYGETIRGLLVVVSPFAGQPTALIHTQVTSVTQLLELVVTSNASRLNLTVGPVTGTTGSLTQLTVSAVSDGVVAIENRMGSTADIVTLLIR